MNFEEFIKEEKVRIAQPDVQKAKALIKMSFNNLKVVDLLEINETSSSSVLVMNYESLRQILEAICLKEGYKVYSHEAYTFYLKKLGEDSLAEKFDRLRKLRNGCNYYGKPVSSIVAKNAKFEVRKMCEILKKKYLIF